MLYRVSYITSNSLSTLRKQETFTVEAPKNLPMRRLRLIHKTLYFNLNTQESGKVTQSERTMGPSCGGPYVLVKRLGFGLIRRSFLFMKFDSVTTRNCGTLELYPRLASLENGAFVYHPRPLRRRQFGRLPTVNRFDHVLLYTCRLRTPPHSEVSGCSGRPWLSRRRSSKFTRLLTLTKQPCEFTSPSPRV